MWLCHEISWWFQDSHAQETLKLFLYSIGCYHWTFGNDLKKQNLKIDLRGYFLKYEKWDELQVLVQTNGFSCVNWSKQNSNIWSCLSAVSWKMFSLNSKHYFTQQEWLCSWKICPQVGQKPHLNARLQVHSKQNFNVTVFVKVASYVILPFENLVESGSERFWNWVW